MGAADRSTTDRRLLAVSLLVLVCMIGSIVAVPWLFEDPYSTTVQYTAIHESAEDFDEQPKMAPSESGPLSIDELSTNEREIVERTITSGTQSTEPNRTTKWFSFCTEALPVCDEFESETFPDRFAEEPRLAYEIETDDGVYLFRQSSHYGPQTSFDGADVIVLLAFVPLLGLLMWQVFRQGVLGVSDPNAVVAVPAYGLVLTIGGIADPFLYMFYDISLRQYSSALVGLTWLLIASVAVAQFRSRSVDHHEAPEQ